jgi:hypothetical protein
MFPSRCFDLKISGKSQKDVIGRTIHTNIQKLLLLYSLIKMTYGLTILESDPYFLAASKLDIFLAEHWEINA